jgi:hypothetical protein
MKQQKYQIGDIRPSQLLWSYGVGAIIDMPHISTMIMSLDDWGISKAEVLEEERLLAVVRTIRGPQVAALYQPPIGEMDSPYSPNPVGVPVINFPRWLVCSYCRLLAPIEDDHFKLIPNPRRPERTCYRHERCNKARNPIVFPARFMIACEGGHLDDFPWQHFVHGNRPCNSTLQLQEFGVTGETAGIYVKCLTCNERRPMSDAFSRDDDDRVYQPVCSGHSPHLLLKNRRKCEDKTHTILLSAFERLVPTRLHHALAAHR